MYENIAVIAVFAFLYSLVAGRMERTPINGALVFVAFGLLFGPVGLGILDLSVERTDLRILADLTLALVLFVDAANADLRVLKSQSYIPGRMLLLGLPLVIGAGMLAGAWLFDEFGIYQLALLATILAATDAALGKAVVTNKALPAGIREGLNAESGLNDGICVPILLTFIALASGGEAEGGNTFLAIKLLASEIGIGLAVGLGVTAIGVQLARVCLRRGWISEIWMQVTTVALAIGCFSVAQSLHGSGYIAAFVGGILFGLLTKSDTHRLVHASEGTAEALALFTWVVFGAAVVGQYFELFTWKILIYSLLSLTAVRMLPIVLVLTGTGEPMAGKLFLGWFGPRGLASIVFMIIVMNENIPGSETMAITVVCTVTLSILLHGLTARPLAEWYTAHEKRHAGDGESA